MGLYPRRLVYETVRSLDDFQPWLDQMQHFPEEVFDSALQAGAAGVDRRRRRRVRAVAGKSAGAPPPGSGVDQRDPPREGESVPQLALRWSIAPQKPKTTRYPPLAHGVGNNTICSGRGYGCLLPLPLRLPCSVSLRSRLPKAPCGWNCSRTYQRALNSSYRRNGLSSATPSPRSASPACPPNIRTTRCRSTAPRRSFCAPPSSASFPQASARSACAPAARPCFWSMAKTWRKTKPQPPNLTGDDPVPPPPVHEDSPLRPAPYPHQDVVAKLRLDARQALVRPDRHHRRQGTVAIARRTGGEFGRRRRTRTAARSGRLAATHRRRMGSLCRGGQRAASCGRCGPAPRGQRRRRGGLARASRRDSRSCAGHRSGSPSYNDIDRFIDARLEEAKVKPLPLTSDLEFLRRVSIDTTGLIPTADEIRAYLADPAGHAPRARHRPAARQSLVGRQLGQLLAGRAGRESGHPQAGPEQHRAVPLVAASIVHRQPADRPHGRRADRDGRQRWSQGGAGRASRRPRSTTRPWPPRPTSSRRRFSARSSAARAATMRRSIPSSRRTCSASAAMLNGKPLKLPVTSTVPLVPGGRVPAVKISLKPGESIEPDWPFQDLIDHAESGPLPGSSSKPSRHALAALVVAPENGRFAQVIVNRVWKRYMGLGLVEPADDWSQAKPSHPELLRLPGARADDARLRPEAHRAADLLVARLPAQAARRRMPDQLGEGRACSPVRRAAT